MNPPDPACPRFGGIDALILGVSLVCGTWLSIMDLNVVERILGLPDSQPPMLAKATRREPPKVGRFERSRRALVDSGGTMLPCLTLGVAVATFRYRWSWSRRALRRVGVLTSAIAGVFVAFLVGGELAFRWYWPTGYGPGHLPISFQLYRQGTGVSLAISALWGVMAIGGRWKSSPEWPNRLGRAIGWAWVVYAVVGVLIQYAGLVIYNADGTFA